MQGSLGQPPIVIRSSRATAALMLSIVAGFVAIGLMMAQDPEESAVIGYLMAGAFSLGIPVFAWRLVRPDTMTLTPDGISWQNMFRTDRWEWSEVQDFHAYKPTSRTIAKHVGFVFTNRGRDGAPGDAAEESTEATGSFGTGWELSAADLADLLNNARGLWLRSRR